MSANELRRLCFKLLPTNADFEAFLIDRFADVQRETSPAMLRSARMNVLLQRHGVAAVWHALRAAFPRELASCQGDCAMHPTHEEAAALGLVDTPAYLDAPTAGELGATAAPSRSVQRPHRRVVLWLAVGLGLPMGLLAGRLQPSLWPTRDGAAGRAASPPQRPEPAAAPTLRSTAQAAGPVAVSTAGAKSPVLIGNRGPITIIYGSPPAATRAPGATAKPGRPSGPDSGTPSSTQPSVEQGTAPAAGCKLGPCPPTRRSLTGTSASEPPLTRLWLPQDVPRPDGVAGLPAPAKIALYRRPLFWGALGGGMAAVVTVIVVAAVVPPYLPISGAFHPEWN